MRQENKEKYEYWPQEPELLATKDTGFRRKRRFVGVVPTCHLFDKSGFAHALVITI
jgi:hypothetical protein